MQNRILPTTVHHRTKVGKGKEKNSETTIHNLSKPVPSNLISICGFELQPRVGATYELVTRISRKRQAHVGWRDFWVRR
jgi:hypothetical protein